MVSRDIRKTSPLGLSAPGWLVDDPVPILRLVAEVDPYLCVAHITRYPLKVIIKRQVIDSVDSAQATADQVAGQCLVLTWFERLGHGVLARPAALGHLDDGTRCAVAEVDLAAVGVVALVGAQHPDRVLPLGDGIETVKHLPVRPVAFVQRNLDFVRAGKDHETEWRVTRSLLEGHIDAAAVGRVDL